MTTLTAEKTDTFMCYACLEDKPVSEKSTDDRYCHWCFDFLTEEAKQYSGRATWIPRKEPVRHKTRKDKSIVKEIARLEKKANGNKKRSAITTQAIAKQHQVAKMAVTPPKAGEALCRRSVTKDNKAKATAKSPLLAGKATPQDKNVTEEKIKELAAQGLKTRAIAKIVGVSHMTVARRLAGQRSMF